MQSNETSQNSEGAAAAIDQNNEANKGFAGWGQESEESSSDEQNSSESTNFQEGEKQKNDASEHDFNRDSFLTEYKKSNPNATDEEISKAEEDAEKKFYSINADLFSEEGAEKTVSKNTFVDQLKAIEGEEFDSLKYSGIETKEEFDNALRSIVDNRVEKKVKEQNQESEFVKGMSDIDRAIFNKLRESGLKGLKEFISPNEKLAQFRSMDDESLVITGLKNQKGLDGKPLYTDEEIERKMAGKEPEDIALEAKGIRSQLDQMEHQNMIEVSKMINNDAEKRKNQAYIEKDRLATNIEKVVSKMVDFKGLPIEENTAQILADNYRKGKFDNLFSDPVFIAKSILYDKIGERAFRSYGKKQYEKGAKLRNENDHNVNGLTDNGSFGSGQGSANKGGFSGWGQ